MQITFSVMQPIQKEKKKQRGKREKYLMKYTYTSQPLASQLANGQPTNSVTLTCLAIFFFPHFPRGNLLSFYPLFSPTGIHHIMASTATASHKGGIITSSKVDPITHIQDTIDG
jgi:hypothetical protein